MFCNINTCHCATFQLNTIKTSKVIQTWLNFEEKFTSVKRMLFIVLYLFCCLYLFLRFVFRNIFGWASVIIRYLGLFWQSHSLIHMLIKIPHRNMYNGIKQRHWYFNFLHESSIERAIASPLESLFSKVRWKHLSRRN